MRNKNRGCFDDENRESHGLHRRRTGGTEKHPCPSVADFFNRRERPQERFGGLRGSNLSRNPPRWNSNLSLSWFARGYEESLLLAWQRKVETAAAEENFGRRDRHDF